MELEKYQYEVLRTFALTHNYNNWIIDMFKPYIGKNILEIGSGIGNLTFYLREMGKLTCIDKSSSFIKHLQIDCPEVDFLGADVTHPSILNLKSKNIDTVVCVNVLEHIENDVLALQNAYQLLAKNGRLLLFVPALPLLYGTLDKNLDHFRRYSKKELLKKLASAGFTVEKIKYNNFIGLFGWFVNSRILRKKRFPILQPLIFDKFIPAIRLLEKFLKIPIGMNLIVVAKKD
ncbi:MAG: hypothetical protein A2252_06140 [Elusimicrobia bacterium RIFOXYA2_FULL_39_19]|nr:MAG: hypothetical protein A2252_06140 [Elusimicrobia bacterium RIFOXYA2_FULL_39_19]